ncbi:hypothetical protein M413DRAFT_449796 [Hebeloma cylindrosporum]|uniref:Uncharacterized protein n=1 Tax=Hebeloma cylindrosporum TaxID=76867 RepID=A0A0C2Y2T6_HEBCY|nr:hypothetical protein M413DRAFT_449796 [Hebeloma cylindrosporum h7]
MSSTVLSPEIMWYEQAANAAASIGAMAYGIHIAVFYKCITTLFRKNDKSFFKWIPFIAGLFVLGTANISCSLHFNQLAFIDERQYPGGPAAFLTEKQSDSANVGAVATSIIMMIAADIFMIYRIHDLWRRTIVTGILSMTLLASIVMSGFHAVQLTRSKGSIGGASVIQFSVPYVSLATTLNILISVILLPRLLELRRQVSLTASLEGIQNKFIGLEALVVESSLPSGLFSLVFIILFGFQKVSSILFLPLLVQVMGIMPGLIVLRIVQGYGWSNDTVRRLRPASSAYESSRRGPAENHHDQDVPLGGIGGTDPLRKNANNFV